MEKGYEQVFLPYKILQEGGSGEIVEKKSRFIATLAPVSSEEEAAAFVESIRKKYWDARHNCSAFVVGERAQLTRCSDDGSRRERQGNRCWKFCSAHSCGMQRS